MGLMIIFPVSEDETDRVALEKSGTDEKITLKSYGLPLIFWGYLLAMILLIIIMTLATKAPLIKLYHTSDTFNQLIAIAAAATLFLIPFISILFYFYEKVISKSKSNITIIHKVFWLPLRKVSYELKSPDAFVVEHFMDSPNVAKMQSSSQMRGFENKGYFQMFLITKSDERVFLDRHSRKADLEKMKTLLSKY